jgi:hypothetical protein
MTYEEFKTEFAEKLKEKAETSERIGEYKFFDDGCTSEDVTDLSFIRQTNIKYSELESDVLKGDFLEVIHKKSKHMVCRFEMKYLYESFEEKGWDKVWLIISKNLEKTECVDSDKIAEDMENYETIKDRLILRPLNFTDNKYEMKEYVYRQIGDMALVLYIYLTNTEDTGLLTMKVYKTVFDAWGKEMDEVMEAALLNSYMKSVPRMYNTYEELSNPKYDTGAYMAVGSKCKLATGLWPSTFTTYPTTNGSISYWYPGVKEKIAKMAGGDYYVVFTGIHDFRVHPVGTVKPRDILRVLKDMNKINPKGETLTRKIYRYKADTKELVQLDL